MMKVLESFEPNVAAGVLARTASWLAFAEPAPALISPAEIVLQYKIVEEAKLQLGIRGDDFSAAALERISDLLDAESDRLLAPLETEAALGRLAERGDLPSDLYRVDYIPNLRNVYGKFFSLEKDIIDLTIKDPDMEQHYGPNRGNGQPAMISLFLRTFRTKWPLKDFIAIVVGQRAGFKLLIHQAWRIFTSKINVSGLETPIDWLKTFADLFGKPFEVGGHTGSFFLYLDKPIPKDIKIDNGLDEVILSRFAQQDSVAGPERSALVMCINVSKYMAMFKDMRVKREDMLDAFGPGRDRRRGERAVLGHGAA